MSATDTKALYRRLLDALNRNDLDAAAALTAEDAVNHAPMPGEPPGIAGLRYRMGMMRTAFPDFRFTAEEIIAEGDKVVTRGDLTGTNSGSFAGMPPTGKRVTVSYIDMVRFADGKLAEHWGQMDQLGVMQQLGVIPTPGQGG
ncbi:MAG: ester cyclase [Thermomicrobiales bacterium]